MLPLLSRTQMELAAHPPLQSLGRGDSGHSRVPQIDEIGSRQLFVALAAFNKGEIVVAVHGLQGWLIDRIKTRSLVPDAYGHRL